MAETCLSTAWGRAVALFVSWKDSTPGRRSSSGTNASTRVMSPFCTMRSPILFSILVTRNPGVVLWTTKLTSATTDTTTLRRGGGVVAHGNDAGVFQSLTR